MNHELDSIYDKIQSLLRMSGDKSSPHEAAIAAQKAATLIRKFNLDLDDVRDWTVTPKVGHENVFLHRYLPLSWQKKENKSRYRKQYKSWPPKTWYEYGQHGWFVHLSTAVARTCGCEAPYFSPGSVTFVGDIVKVKQAAFLMGNIFRRMMLMLDQAINDYSRDYKVEHGVSPYRESGYRHPAKFRVTYLEGLAFEIASKMYDAVREHNESKSDTRSIEKRQALVVIKNAIEVYKNEHFGHVTQLEEVEADGSSAGYMAGVRDGKNFTTQHGINGVPIAELRSG